MEELRRSGARIKIFKNKSEAARHVAEEVASEIRDGKKFNLGLAAGRTMIPIYSELVRLYGKGGVDFSNVRTFDIDEYLDDYLERNKNKGFEFFLKKNFLSNVNVKESDQIFLREEGDFKKSCKQYEKKILKDRIDLLLLGIGRNGHIAFNEPGSSFKSKTRKVKLDRDTREVNKKLFEKLEDTPTHALTIGIGTILKSKKIVLIAFGRKKARAVARALIGRARTEVPASSLTKHKEVTFIVDKNAASLIGKV